MFSHFSNFEVYYLPEYLTKPCGFIRGIHVLLLNVPDKFHYLSPKHLDVTSSSLVTNFCNFSENRLFLDSNYSSIETVGN